MEINVSQLLKAPIGTTRYVQINDAVDIAGDGTVQPVQGELELLRTLRGILVKGVLNTEVELICSRCLNSFRYPLSLHIEEEYLPSLDIISGLPLPLPEEPSAFTIDGHHILDLTEAVRQYSLLAIPMKPLCREDCAGLCQKCGDNLNLGTCDCPAEVIDSRWAELTKLL